MKEFNVEPGSADWLSVRLGIPTASNFHRIITPAKRQYSKQARAYAFRLVAEKLLNQSLDTIDYIEHVQRGKDMEPTAIKMFEIVEEAETAPVGFLATDDLSAGATPDRRIIGQAAFLECKCPAQPAIHLQYLIDGFGDDYIAQAQGQNYVGESEWVARWSYHPEMPPALVKTYRDETFIAALRDAIAQFNDEKAEIERKARASGFFEERLRMGQLALDELTQGDLGRLPPTGAGSR